MLDTVFSGIFSTEGAINLSLSDFFICMISSIILGVITAKIYALKTKCTQGFLATLAMLPLAVTMVIIMVNGNIGAGVAVAGPISLVRFRSVPRTAKEIAAIITAMSTGLTIDIRYIAFAAMFTIIACAFMLVLNIGEFGKQNNATRTLHITIPENLNYTNVFDDIFSKYTNSVELVSAKTTNMGSLFKLSYEIELKNTDSEKEFIDELRTRNGNLEIIITKQDLLQIGL